MNNPAWVLHSSSPTRICTLSLDYEANVDPSDAWNYVAVMKHFYSKYTPKNSIWKLRDNKSHNSLVI